MVIIGGRKLSLDDFFAILFKDEAIKLDEAGLFKRWMPVSSS